jgi:glutathione S-transferase
LLAYSHKATVPVLVLPDGRVLDESIDIVDWALSMADPQGLLKPLCGEGRALAQRLIAQNDQQFKPLLDRYKYADRYPQQSQRDYRQQAEAFLVLLAARLQRGQFLLGAKQARADVAIFSFIRQFAAVDSAWFERSPYPALRSWLEHGTNSHSFAVVMDKVPRWQPGQAACVFPSAVV